MYKTTKDFKKDIQKITDSLTTKKRSEMLKVIEDKKYSLSKMLKDYCPWLANFSAGRMNLELEIPGQYSGEKLPLVQHHVKISGFCETVSVMSSLRKPIKVTMLGMDSKEYPFLIKFGEDIRQDQRIQQLFMHMNTIFANDNKNEHLLTYQVSGKRFLSDSDFLNIGGTHNLYWVAILKVLEKIRKQNVYGVRSLF